MKWEDPKGFVLMELLVVFAIIGALAAMFLPALQGARPKAKYARWLGYKNNIRGDPSLVAHYTFEEGNGIKLNNEAVGGSENSMSLSTTAPGTMDGTITGATWVKNGGRWAGKNTLSFDGNDYVNCKTNNKLAFTISESFTLEAWIYVPSLPGAWKAVVTKSRDISPHYGIWISNGNVWQWGGKDIGGGGNYNIPGSAVTVGWHNVAIVQIGNTDVVNTARHIYVDGKKEGTGIATNANGGGTFYIGGVAGEYFNGTIDEVAVYNRALSAQEINGYYEMGRP